MRKEQKKRTANRMSAVCLAVCLTMSAGCGQKQEEAEPIVELKENGTETGEGEAKEITASGARRSAAGSIAEQTQAPDVYQISFTDESGALQIMVDAQVRVPAAEGFCLKSVTGRTFTQEDYDRVVEGVPGVSDQTLTGWVINEEGKEERKDFRPEIRYDVEAAISGVEGANFMAGTLMTEGGEYMVYLDNNLTPDFRWVTFAMERESGTWMPSPEPEEGEEGLKAMTEQIAAKAEEAVKRAGFTDMIPFERGYFCLRTFDDSMGGNGEPVEELYGYGVQFARSVDGIPITCTNETGAASEGDTPAWPYESLRLVYDEEGLVNFEWRNPYTVTDMSSEYVFLLPFEEIQQVFRRMSLEKYSPYVENGGSMELRIDEIRLGYMRIMSPGNPTEGTLVPVWDFMGSMERTVAGGNGEEDSHYGISGPGESWLTINAMDGTVIDRSLGY